MTRGGAALVLVALAWIAVAVLSRLWLLTVAAAVALLLTALLEPVARRLQRWSVPGWLAALLCILVMLAVPAGVAFLLVSRASAQVDDLGATLAAAVNDLRDWLVHGPPNLSPEQVDQLRNDIVAQLRGMVPSVTAGARTVARLAAAVLVVVFVVFFLLKDGTEMWRWVLAQVAPDSRDRLDVAGHAAWHTLTRYVGGVVLVALIDAGFIGLGLVLIGVPLTLALALLVFLGAFVPLIGATVSGAVAVLVALSTRGLTSALLVLAVVLLVQQLEGNVLQPVLMGHAVALHPVIIVLSVTAGALLLGITGAVIAVPVVAVAYAVIQSLRQHSQRHHPAPG